VSHAEDDIKENKIKQKFWWC